MFDWRRMLTDLGWAMAMTEPMCYSYYLASRTGSTHREGAPTYQEEWRERPGNRGQRRPRKAAQGS